MLNKKNLYIQQNLKKNTTSLYATEIHCIVINFFQR